MGYTAVVISFFLALCGPAFSATTASMEDQVNVTVYFESYCPDSVKFITKQLYPAYMTPLKDRTNISLIPYGKATKNQSGVITCHHGEHECFGNKVIACALKNTSLIFDDVFKFINCTSSLIAQDPKKDTYPINECVVGSPLSSEALMECANGASGQEYLVEYGEITDALSPALSSVPTVVFNGKFDSNDNTEAMTNFVKSVCGKMKGSKLAECVRNSAGGLQSTVLPMVVAALIATRV